MVTIILLHTSISGVPDQGGIICGGGGMTCWRNEYIYHFILAIKAPRTKHTFFLTSHYTVLPGTTLHIHSRNVIVTIHVGHLALACVYAHTYKTCYE